MNAPAHKTGLKRVVIWARRVSLGALALVLVVTLLALLLLNTQWGARLTLAQSARFIPGELDTGNVSGTLAGPLRLAGASYRHDGLGVNIESLAVDVSVLTLLTGRIDVAELSASGIVVTVPEGEPDESRDDPVALPVITTPMPVHLARAKIGGLLVRLPDGTEFALDRAVMAGTLASSTLQLDELEVASSLGSLSLAGSLDTRRRYATRVRASLALNRADATLRSRLEVRGDLDAMDVSVLAHAPLDASLEAHLADLTDRPSGRFNLSARSVEPALIGLGSVPGPLRGSLEGEISPTAIQTRGWLAGGNRRVAIHEFAASLTEQGVALERLILEGEEGARLTASGRFAFHAEVPVVSLDAKWSDVAVPLGADRVLASPEGSVRVAGRPSDYRYEADLRLAGWLPEGHWRLSGQGGLSGLTLASLQAQTLNGDLSGEGEVDWRPVLQWRAEVNARELNPGAVAPQWPGSLSARVFAAGRLQDGVPRGEFSVQNLAGRLRERSVSGSAEAQFNGTRLPHVRVNLESGDSLLDAGGSLDEAVDLHLKARVQNLANWLPDAEGSLEVRGCLQGPRNALHANGEFGAESFAWAGVSIGSLEGEADVHLSGARASRVTTSARQLELRGIPFQSVEATLTGTPARHSLSLDARDEGQAVRFSVAGGWDGSLWQGELQDLAAASARYGEWRLTGPATATVAAHKIRLANLCLRAETAGMCARGRWSADQGLEAHARLEQVPLGTAELLLGAALDRPLTLDGRVNAEADLRVPADAPARIRVRLDGDNASIAMLGNDGEARLALSPLQAMLRLDDRVLEVSAQVGLGGAGSVSLSLDSPDFVPARWAQAPVNGRVDVALDEFEPLDPLLEPLVAPVGSLQGELALGGTLGALALDGKFALAGFAAEVPAAGLALEEGRLSLRAVGGEIGFQGGVSSGGGRVDVTGTMNLGGGQGLRIRAQVAGTDFLAVNRPGLQARVSPELDLALQSSTLTVTGRAAVPSATVDAGRLEGGGVSASPDVVVAGRGNAADAGVFRLVADVDVTLGEQVKVRAPGFEGAARGELHVTERPGRPTQARGELKVTGSYEAYGQKLSIRSGRLLYAGTPIDNPALDITAVRKADEVTAGIRIGGTALDPRLTLFSEPPLGSEADVLSYLILGRPMDAASSGDGALLSGAATSLGLKGGDLLAKQIGAQFGISDIGVEQSDTLDQSVLTLGKYLSPRLYVSYGVGLVEPVSVIRFRYELTDHWMLEAASGAETSGAIKFYFER